MIETSNINDALGARFSKTTIDRPRIDTIGSQVGCSDAGANSQDPCSSACIRGDRDPNLKCIPSHSFVPNIHLEIQAFLQFFVFSDPFLLTM